MQWDETGRPAGYDYQRAEIAGVTVRSTPVSPEPRPLSRENSERIRNAVRHTERDVKSAPK